MLPVVARGCQTLTGKILSIIGAPLLVLSILISGRSGLMMSLFFVPVYLLGLLLLKTGDHSPARLAGKLLTNVLVISVICLLVWSSIGYLPPKFADYSLNHAQEIFSALQLYGPTVENISEMFFLPDSWLEVFFGSSNLNHGDFESIQSDVGWVKTIFAVGLLGSTLMLAPYILALIQAWRCRVFSQEITIMSLLVFVSALLLNSKEMALLTRNQWSVQSLLLVAISMQLFLQADLDRQTAEQAKSEPDIG